MKDKDSKFYVYILECSDKSYYVGYTRSLFTRLKYHYRGEGAAYTRKRQPVKLVFYREFPNKYAALNAERQIKNWSREKKKAFIYRAFELLQALSKNSYHKSICLKFYPLDVSTSDD